MQNANDVVETIATVIAPYVGPSMARTAVRAQAERLKFTEGPAGPAEVEALLARVGSGLNVFVGREKSAVILQEARKALGQRMSS